MNKKIFVRAEEGEPPGISVVYYDSDGNKTIRYHDKNEMERNRVPRIPTHLPCSDRYTESL